MKKSKNTRLTAMMFAAAGVGCLMAGAAVPDATTAIAREKLCGDLNGSGELEVKDIILFQKYLHGKKVEVSLQTGDMNGDGEVDVFDLELLKRSVLAQQEEPSETMPVPVYGPPEWFTTEPTEIESLEPTTEPQEVYGPPEWFTTEPTEIETDTTDPTEDIPVPVYGPPEWFTDPSEETTDPTEEPSEEPTVIESLEPITEPQDVYGPPEWFTDVTETETTDPPIQTVYGPPISLD